MFDSVGWGEILVLIVAGLFILGPERLPSAAAWLGKTVRQVREYATGAKDQLRNELGPEFDELRKPLEDLRGLRNFNPRTAVRRSLFDDGDLFGEKPNGHAPGANGSGGATTPQQHPAAPKVPEKLAPNERPPIDPDAT
ncbi:MAG: Sec-independent protein translocase protein TatB [Pseudonocardia sp.]|nr:Sec-independent protein translocase protein TatB [Pseudonocardia sp.]